MYQRPVVEKKKTAAAAESSGPVCLPDTQKSSSAFAHCSSSQSSYTQKAKELDTHLPSLKRRRLSECRDEGTVSMTTKYIRQIFNFV